MIKCIFAVCFLLYPYTNFEKLGEALNLRSISNLGHILCNNGISCCNIMDMLCSFEVIRYLAPFRKCSIQVYFYNVIKYCSSRISLLMLCSYIDVLFWYTFENSQSDAKKHSLNIENIIIQLQIILMVALLLFFLNDKGNSPQTWLAILYISVFGSLSQSISTFTGSNDYNTLDKLYTIHAEKLRRPLHLRFVPVIIGAILGLCSFNAIIYRGDLKESGKVNGFNFLNSKMCTRLFFFVASVGICVPLACSPYVVPKTTSGIYMYAILDTIILVSNTVSWAYLIYASTAPEISPHYSSWLRWLMRHKIWTHPGDILFAVISFLSFPAIDRLVCILLGPVSSYHLFFLLYILHMILGTSSNSAKSNLEHSHEKEPRSPSRHSTPRLNPRRSSHYSS